MNEEQEEYRGEVAKAHFLQKLDSEVWNNTNFPYDWEKYSYGFKLFFPTLTQKFWSKTHSKVADELGATLMFETSLGCW